MELWTVLLSITPTSDFPSQTWSPHRHLEANILGSCQTTLSHPVQQKISSTTNENERLASSPATEPLPGSSHNRHLPGLCPPLGPRLHPHPQSSSSRRQSSLFRPSVRSLPSSAVNVAWTRPLRRDPAPQAAIPGMTHALSLYQPTSWVLQFPEHSPLSLISRLCPRTRHHLTFSTGHMGTPLYNFWL